MQGTGVTIHKPLSCRAVNKIYEIKYITKFSIKTLDIYLHTENTIEYH